jgi:2-aminobenzoate-CoA ligase
METAAEAVQGLRVLYFNGPEGLETRMTAMPKRFANHLSDAADIAIIGFTSGTTGKPKGTLHSHHAVLAVCETFSKQVVQPSSQDIFGGTPPLGFVYGLGGQLLFPLYARAATVMLEDVRTGPLVEAIAKYRISVLFTAPTAYKALLESYDAEQLGSLRKCISAGEALPAHITQGWLDRAGIRLLDGIGSTEMLHIFVSVQQADDPVGSLGRAVPGYEARVVDREGQDVAIGQVGYLAVRGPTGCRYLDDERQTRYAVNGWNITGDSVKMDAAGYLWYQARTDGMIISSGYNIAGPEVEQTVSQHPAVAECAVIGIPDAGRGNIVCACVVLRDEYQPGDALVRDIQEFARQHSAPYKYPRSVKFIDALPRTPTGKVQHFVLREQAIAELEGMST